MRVVGLETLKLILIKVKNISEEEVCNVLYIKGHLYKYIQAFLLANVGKLLNEPYKIHILYKYKQTPESDLKSENGKCL